MTPDLLPIGVVEQRTGLKKSRIYQLIAAGAFPQPVRAGARAIRFVSTEVDAWVAARIAERDATIGKTKRMLVKEAEVAAAPASLASASARTCATTWRWLGLPRERSRSARGWQHDSPRGVAAQPNQLRTLGHRRSLDRAGAESCGTRAGRQVRPAIPRRPADWRR
jgi:prophage regulatory protein